MKGSKNDLIAKQCLKISELEEIITEYQIAFENIYNILFCIGGPLNDNKLEYTKRQMTDLIKIADLIKYFVED